MNILRYVDDKLTVIVMNNLDEDHCDILQVSGAIASIYIPATKGRNPVKDWWIAALGPRVKQSRASALLSGPPEKGNLFP